MICTPDDVDDAGSRSMILSRTRKLSIYMSLSPLLYTINKKEKSNNFIFLPSPLLSDVRVDDKSHWTQSNIVFHVKRLNCK